LSNMTPQVCDFAVSASVGVVPTRRKDDGD